MTNPDVFSEQVDVSQTAGRAGLMSVASNLLLGLAGFASAVVANRVLGPTGRGELTIIQTIPSILALLAAIGLPDAALFRIAQRPDEGGRVISTATATALTSSVLVALFGFALAPVLLSGRSESVVQGFRWYLLLCPLMAVFTVWTQPLRAINRFGLWNFFRIGVGVAWLLAVLAAPLLGSDDPRLVTTAHMVFLSVLLLIAMVVALPRYAHPFEVRRTLIRPLVRFGFPTALASIPQTLNLRVDQIVMSVVVAERDLGLYAAAVGWSWIVNPVLHGLGAVLFPAVAQSSDRATGEMRFQAGSRTGVAAAIVVGIGALAVTPTLFTLAFGAEYREAVPLALVVLVSGVISAMNVLLEESTKGLGSPRVVLYAELSGLVVTALLLFPLIHALGTMGAALTSIAAYSTTLVYLSSSAHRRQRCRWRDLLLIRRTDVHRVVALLRRS